MKSGKDCASELFLYRELVIDYDAVVDYCCLRSELGHICPQLVE